MKKMIIIIVNYLIKIIRYANVKRSKIMTRTKFIYLLNSTSKNTKSIFSRVFIV